MIKLLKDISWQISEPEYRDDPALSYSTLSRYERGGFNSLSTLFDKIESPSLIFGSAVDALITGGQEEFDNNFIVADFSKLPDSYIALIKELYNIYGKAYEKIVDIPDDKVIPITEKLEFQKGWKPETRDKVIKEKGGDYYKLLALSENKHLVNSEFYTEVLAAVDALRTSPSTSFYFAKNNPFDDTIQRFYQLKFKAELDGIIYRCMADLLIVDHKAKTVQPVDLKTSSHFEYEFYKSFLQWNYQIQARLYWRIIKNIMEQDEIFKDYTLLPYKFIVVNKTSLNPLVWDCPFTGEYGTLTFGKNNQIKLRDPQEIGKELDFYLKQHPIVPKGIHLQEGNNLTTWLETYE